MSVRGRAFQIRRHIVRRKRGGKEKRKNGKAGGGGRVFAHVSI